MIRDEDVERALVGEGDIVPSSGFTSSVMREIHEKSEFAPIPFPWKRAVGGFSACAAIVIVFIATAPRTATSANQAVQALSAATAFAAFALCTVAVVRGVMLSRVLKRH